jgi:hypothetical protein
MNDAKKKQYRQRRTYIRTADSLGREACGITDASPESLHPHPRRRLGRSSESRTDDGRSAGWRSRVKPGTLR